MQHEASELTWDTRVDLARSFGVTEEDAFWIARITENDPEAVLVMYCAYACIRVYAKKRTRRNLRRFVLRNRFEGNRKRFNFWEGQHRRHVRGVIRDKSGMRCHDCKDVPPQPGEIMEEEE